MFKRFLQSTVGDTRFRNGAIAMFAVVIVSWTTTYTAWQMYLGVEEAKILEERREQNRRYDDALEEWWDTLQQYRNNGSTTTLRYRTV
jgi:hypothetical protein